MYVQVDATVFCPNHYVKIYRILTNFVFRPELRFGAVGDFNAPATEVPGRGTLLVLVLGSGKLGRVTRLGTIDLAARGRVALRSTRFEGV